MRTEVSQTRTAGRNRAVIFMLLFMQTRTRTNGFEYECSENGRNIDETEQ